jgi:hypothetical protein
VERPLRGQIGHLAAADQGPFSGEVQTSKTDATIAASNGMMAAPRRNRLRNKKIRVNTNRKGENNWDFDRLRDQVRLAGRLINLSLDSLHRSPAFARGHRCRC